MTNGTECFQSVLIAFVGALKLHLMLPGGLMRMFWRNSHKIKIGDKHRCILISCEMRGNIYIFHQQLNKHKNCTVKSEKVKVPHCQRRQQIFSFFLHSFKKRAEDDCHLSTSVFGFGCLKDKL